MDFKDLPKAYDSKDVEAYIYKRWEENGFFNPDKLPERNQQGAPFCISMPPPNVTGVLHLGHTLENALMDTMVRFERMRGKKAVIVPGTDHAAIATQAKVEKMLIADGMEYPREELGREKLLEKIREFAEGSKATMINQIRKIGTSCDWSRLAYTFDEERNTAVNELFTRMYNDGLIYRGYRVVNWTVKGQSTCSDDEIEYVDRKAKFYTFKYSKDFPIVIATTRPETKLGDTAVAVHPNDDRYKQFIGQTFSVDVGASKPLNIKVIADEEVDPEFGTGALGVTPAHSAVDFAMYEKQKAKGDPIDIIPVIGEDGRMTAEAGEAYQGLTAVEAREKFVQYLKDNDLLIKEEEIDQSVGTSDRYGDVIEAIPKTQWWLDMNKEIPGRGKSLRDLMRDAVTTGLDGDKEKLVTITPDRFTKLYLDRVENLRDWCLSRQIWWGHRIPVWYKGEEIHVGNTAPEGEGWEQDPDTLDTWFSSGSWTFSTLGWPNETLDLNTFHPTQWMQMGYEILYLWLMRMVLMSTYLFNDIPFKDAYIHGILRDKEGKKFSKSSGNGIDPIEVVDEYGSDALRISLLFGISAGNDSRYYTEKIENGRNFTNKLWNISRFILTNIKQESSSARRTTNNDSSEGEVRSSKYEIRTLSDKWILSRLEEVTASVTKKLETYQFSPAGEELRDFTWNDLADWYLEIAKVEKGKQEILMHILPTILKLWHPFMPFVTEFIWSQFNQDQLIVAPWPQSQDDVPRTMDQEVNSFETLRSLITDLRRLRAEQGIEAAKFVEYSIVADTYQHQLIEENHEVIKSLTRAESINIEETIAEGWATDVSGTMTIGLNLAGAIDVEAEKIKLQKEIEELAPYIKSTEAKLENADFTSKAPEHVVNSMKDKLDEAKKKQQALKERMKSL
ncbi:MAG: valine--tRNA ligase [Patescibacteria group bacterium]|nr:valine--tRNA ligase [Patescibacteria group bacterium]